MNFKKLLKDANNKFNICEIWVNNDNFWGFNIDGWNITITKGFMEEGDTIVYLTTNIQSSDPDSFIDDEFMFYVLNKK